MLSFINNQALQLSKPARTYDRNEVLKRLKREQDERIVSYSNLLDAYYQAATNKKLSSSIIQGIARFQGRREATIEANIRVIERTDNRWVVLDNKTGILKPLTNRQLVDEYGPLLVDRVNTVNAEKIKKKGKKPEIRTLENIHKLTDKTEEFLDKYKNDEIGDEKEKYPAILLSSDELLIRPRDARYILGYDRPPPSLESEDEDEPVVEEDFYTTTSERGEEVKRVESELGLIEA